MFINDVLAGMVLVVSSLLTIVALVGYRRYRLKAMIFNALVFAIMLIGMVVYILNILFEFGFDEVTILLSVDAFILFLLYFAMSFKG